MSRSDPEAYITRPGYSGLSASLPLVQRKSQTERGVTRSNSSEQLASSRRIASREILFYSIYHSAFSIHRWYSCLFRRSILSSPLSVGKSKRSSKCKLLIFKQKQLQDFLLRVILEAISTSIIG
ncbi:hypothetical protein PCASD_09558 [Puccinia coronata f. sp. avenae]|uniref:Uncharacterized protein n=1 Tax=Puccinia coronata f. sp. avenae TaxID=200324 RepID=A0A2N5SR72_9BASI|nr:hypothetical protein PCASD_22364 [Puccinia coronata f. sp. avenae]PLW44136.1 hypothetical protein PCASD_09558 [Puccinia coronata f. sp. avenae]